MLRFLLSLVFGWFTLSSPSLAQDSGSNSDKNNGSAANDAADPAQDSSADANKSDVPRTLQFKMKSIDGKEVDLSKYAGKVVVIVNTASKCGMTPQYKDLQALHEKYSEKGLAILGFPCNQFLSQEPGDEEEIKSFCEKKYGVEFDMFSKIEVNGPKAAELFKLLTSLDAKPVGSGKVGWNFEKFILDKSGNLVARFGSRAKPGSKEFVEKLEAALNE
jgi:glutathione peroxidase